VLLAQGACEPMAAVAPQLQFVGAIGRARIRTGTPKCVLSASASSPPPRYAPKGKRKKDKGKRNKQKEWRTFFLQWDHHGQGEEPSLSGRGIEEKSFGGGGAPDARKGAREKGSGSDDDQRQTRGQRWFKEGPDTNHLRAHNGTLRWARRTRKALSARTRIGSLAAISTFVVINRFVVHAPACTRPSLHQRHLRALEHRRH
jgi:hypothetical protein